MLSGLEIFWEVDFRPFWAVSGNIAVPKASVKHSSCTIFSSFSNHRFSRESSRFHGDLIEPKKRKRMVKMDRRIREHRQQILEIAQRYGAYNVRIFGSQARNEEASDSDVDLLVEFEQPNLLDRIAMKQDLEDLLGMKVDLLTDETIHPALREQILREARPL
jgi:predicted nucleotidyltransferase